MSSRAPLNRSFIASNTSAGTFFLSSCCKTNGSVRNLRIKVRINLPGKWNCSCQRLTTLDFVEQSSRVRAFLAPTQHSSPFHHMPFFVLDRLELCKQQFVSKLNTKSDCQNTCITTISPYPISSLDVSYYNLIKYIFIINCMNFLM